MDGGSFHADANPRRVDNIDIKVMSDGYIVHQPGRDRIHYLNHTAALILELCSGKASADDISRIVGDAFGMTVPPGAEVEACLGRFVAEELVDHQPPDEKMERGERK